MSTWIDTADTVKHIPSGEEWVVAYVDGDQLCPCGWPLTLANLSDCLLVTKATETARQNLLVGMSVIEDDPRGDHARRALEF